MRVVVLGAGYAGVVLTRRLERRLPADAELVVVDETGTHLVQHELHRLIRRPRLVEDVVVPLEDVFEWAETRTATVAGVDHEERVVRLADGEALAYDVAAVCLGAETAFYGIPGLEEHALPLKRVDHADRIRHHFRSAVVDEGGGQVVVGGAGLSGVQVAGELAAFAHEEDLADAVDVVLLEQLDDVAPSFPPQFRDAVRSELERQGVEVRTGTTVEGVTDDHVHVADGEQFAHDVLVWTGGIRGPAALDAERPRVRADLALDEHTFVLGDAARVVDAEGTAVPASAQTAVREATVVAANVETLVREGDESGFRPRFERYTYDSPGWIVSVGDGAVAQVGPSVFTGAAAKAAKASVGASYLASAGVIRNAVDLLREEFAD